MVIYPVYLPRPMIPAGAAADNGDAPAGIIGRRVAVIGGGPGGLSAAYFLRARGHAVTVYDAMPQMGGMLRYGIPEYRLPKKVLSREIDVIAQMGVSFQNNVKIGRDVTLDYLRGAYDAVIVAVGAWSSTALRCKGEELDGVLGGIDFLRDAAAGGPVFAGRKIAVVGGGNTAMDACRTAVRLGAAEVCNIYRRTKTEMPAEAIEIKEAEEEGVIFKNLTNPIEILGENGKVKTIRLQIMALGEPDASGRRAPVPVPGKEELLEVDTVIAAIGQKPMLQGFDELEKSKWGTLLADEHTFRTNLPGVFAIGDATNRGAGIAISAIGEAKKAAEAVTLYLQGEEITYQPPYLVKSDKTAKDFAGRPKEARVKHSCRPAEERRRDFLEVNEYLTWDQAEQEAARCLECGCHDYFECKLIAYANQYAVQPEKYSGKVHHRIHEDNHPFIHRNPDKCVLCGLCVRICDEVVGATALGLVGRGFDTAVKPALETPLRDTGCISCGQCVHVCPTGALTETTMLEKQVPLKETATETVCAFCSVGCKIRLTSRGDSLIRSLPAEDGLLCVKGRFASEGIGKSDRLELPLVKDDGCLVYDDAYVYADKSLQGLQTQYGKDSVAVAVSDRYTNEEAFLIKEYAEKALRTDQVFSFGMTESGLADVLGRDASTAALDEMESTDLIVVIAPDEIMLNHAVAGMRIRKAAQSGARLLLLSDSGSLLDSIADTRLPLDALPQMVESLGGPVNTGSVSPEAGAAAETLQKAKKAVLVFPKNAMTRDAARLIADLAVLSGHHEGARNGILQLLPGANSQGLVNLGLQPGARYIRKIESGEIKGLFIFGEDVPDVDLSKLNFLAVQELHMTETAKKAHVVFPASCFTEISGTFTAADGKVQTLKPAIGPVSHPHSFMDTLHLLQELSRQAGAPFPYAGTKDVTLPRPAPAPGTIRLTPPEGTSLRRTKTINTNELDLRFMAAVKEQI